MSLSFAFLRLQAETKSENIQKFEKIIRSKKKLENLKKIEMVSVNPEKIAFLNDDNAFTINSTRNSHLYISMKRDGVRDFIFSSKSSNCLTLFYNTGKVEVFEVKNRE